MTLPDAERPHDPEVEPLQFAVYANVDGHRSPLLALHLPFGRLLNDIVLPYQTERPFFIDGVPVSKAAIQRIKIVQETAGLRRLLGWLHDGMRRGPIDKQRIFADQYHVRLEAVFREAADDAPDVTAQIIDAFDRRVKPSLKDYLPKREELISAALSLFLEGARLLGR